MASRLDELRAGPAVVRRGCRTRAAHAAAGSAPPAREPRRRGRARAAAATWRPRTPRRCASRASSQACWSSLAPRMRPSRTSRSSSRPPSPAASSAGASRQAMAGMALDARPCPGSARYALPAIASSRCSTTFWRTRSRRRRAASTIDGDGGARRRSGRAARERPGPRALAGGEGPRVRPLLARETRAGTAAGLGLAIVRRLAERDGGSVELADSPGGGLEVIVRLRT